MNRALAAGPRALLRPLGRAPPPLVVVVLRRPVTTTTTTTTATSSTAGSSRSRRTLPFLGAPSPLSSLSMALRSRPRHFTTQPRRRLTFGLIAKWLAVYAATTASIFTIAYVFQEESLERGYPTPREWSHLSRSALHTALSEVDRPATGDETGIEWVYVASMAEAAVRRLEDPKTDGEGLKQLRKEDLVGSGSGSGVGGVDAEDLLFARDVDDNQLGFDVTGKSEEWRRGYHQVLMLLAQGSEHLEGAMTHKKTRRTFRKEYIIGPSYPSPRPLPSHEKTAAPREHECEPAFEPPPNYYLRIVTTRGFTHRQRMDAALACASFYGYKGQFEAAERMHQWALSLAVASTPNTPAPFDRATLIVDDKSPQLPSANVIDALTAFATFRAAHGDATQTLPILVSLLRARRRCPPVAVTLPPVPELPGFDEKPAESTISWLLSIVAEPPYPPPPPDGTEPPERNAKALCEEAALGLYIGEILFAAGKREDGLSWTREGVDISEEQLRLLQISHVTLDPSQLELQRQQLQQQQQGQQTPQSPQEQSNQAAKTCRQCLGTGLGNWTKMAALLAQEEADENKDAAATSVVMFWKNSSQSSRWADEQKVVEARTRRTRDLLVKEDKPDDPGLSSLVIV